MPPAPLASRRSSTLLGLSVLLLLASGSGRAADGANPSIEIRPTSSRPGDVLLVVITGTSKSPTGTLGDRTLHFYPLGDHHEALAPISLDAEEGPLTVTVDTEGAELTAAIEIQPGNFPERELTVDKKFVAIPESVKARIAADQRAFDRAYRVPFGPRLFTEGFARPRDSEVTAHFGDQRTLNGKKKTVHYGLDLDGSVGEPITAANDGRVVMVRDCYTTGNTVLISHGGGVFTGYFHLSAFKVKQGAKVKRGDLIGLVGKTGRVTGPHLHFTTRVDGLYVNPEAMLALPFP